MDEFAFSLVLVGAGTLTLILDRGLARLSSPESEDFRARFGRHRPVAWAMIAFGAISLLVSPF